MLSDREKKILFLLIQGMSAKEVIDAIDASAKLTKADAGRLKRILDRIYAGMPSKIDAARLIASMPKKEFEEFLVGKEKTVIIDAISARAKLSKADAGRALDAAIESIHKKLKTVFGGRGQ